MKRILIAICFSLIFGNRSNAQGALPMTDGKVVFTEVVDAKDKTKDQLFDNGKKWFSEYYKNPKTIKTEDKPGSTLVGESHFKVHKAKGSKDEMGAIYYTITLGLKDGRYKYTITEMSHRDYTKKDGSIGKIEQEKPPASAKSVSEKEWIAIRDQIPGHINTITESLKKTMLSGNAPAKGDDW